MTHSITIGGLEFRAAPSEDQPGVYEVGIHEWGKTEGWIVVTPEAWQSLVQAAKALGEVGRLKAELAALTEKHDRWCRMFGVGWAEGSEMETLAILQEKLHEVTAARDESCLRASEAITCLSNHEYVDEDTLSNAERRISALRKVGTL